MCSCISDKALFDLGEYVNKQNCHMWGTNGVTVWCVFWSRVIIGPFFLRKWARIGRYNQWRSLSGHVERIFVHKNLRGGFWRYLASNERRYVPHRRCYTPRFWRSHYQPRSWCSLVTSELRFDAVCYADKPETINALKCNIRETIGEIQLHIVDNVLKNGIARVSYCMANQDSQFNEIIFHY